MEFVERLRTGYKALFTGGDPDSDEASDRDFSERFGWFTIIEAVSQVHSVSFNQVKRLRGDEFINTWAYIHDRNKLERAKMNRLRHEVRA